MKLPPEIEASFLGVVASEGHAYIAVKRRKLLEDRALMLVARDEIDKAIAQIEFELKTWELVEWEITPGTAVPPQDDTAPRRDPSHPSPHDE